MEQRVSFITVAVDDFDAARRFYVDGLGWRPTMDVPGEVLMIRVPEHLVLSFWDQAAFEAELGATKRGEGIAPVTLAHNLATRDEVDAVSPTLFCRATEQRTGRSGSTWPAALQEAAHDRV